MIHISILTIRKTWSLSDRSQTVRTFYERQFETMCNMLIFNQKYFWNGVSHILVLRPHPKNIQRGSEGLIPTLYDRFLLWYFPVRRYILIIKLNLFLETKIIYVTDSSLNKYIRTTECQYRYQRAFIRYLTLVDLFLLLSSGN